MAVENEVASTLETAENFPKILEWFTAFPLTRSSRNTVPAMNRI
jgi:hypothetical protein